MGCKAFGAQEPGHNMQSGQLPGIAQRSRPPAQQFIQRFPNRPHLLRWPEMPILISAMALAASEFESTGLEPRAANPGIPASSANYKAKASS
jgi:hypothetical protein